MSDFTSTYMPHGHCYLWQTPLVWLHIISDASIALAYFAIPILLIYFVRQRQDTPFKPVFLLFGAFIIFCGTGHLLDVWTLWHPDYWLSGAEKAFTAIVSLYTVWQLTTIIPQALSLPSPEQLSQANQELAQQIEERQQAEIMISQLNQQLQSQIEGLQKLDRLKNDFLSTVSHELRTPLASIKMAIKLLKLITNQLDQTHEAFIMLIKEELSSLKDTQQRFSQKRDHYLKILEDQCDREVDLVNDLLNLQHFESQNYEISTESLALGDWLSEFIQPWPLFYASHNQKFILEQLTPLPTVVTAPDLLERIVAELLTNASKYSPPDEQITLSIATDSSKVVLQVTNTGTIIALSEQERIFDKFYRIPNGDPWKRGGTGLGLALAREAATALQSTLTIESPIVDDGAAVRFTLTLPAGLPFRDPALEPSSKTT